MLFLQRIYYELELKENQKLLATENEIQKIKTMKSRFIFFCTFAKLFNST